MIKAPFNFVPLNEKVFFPDWADQISHDIPFEDGESGVIELTITAHSPIFVRNGHTKADAEAKNENYKSFSKINDKYFIPATSIKGAIRNVLEIMSFGKMTQVENDSFGLRDLNDSSYRDMMKKIHCGWLKTEGDKILLTDCGEPKRLSIKEIDRLLKTSLYGFISNGNNFRQGKGRDARLKYEELFVSLTSNKKTDKNFQEKFLSSRDYLLEGTFEEKTGTIVLTGQPGVREYKSDRKNPKTKKMGMWVGKEKEFIFPYTNQPPLEVPDEIFNAFKSIHKNTPDYKNFWRIKFQKGEEIPVFFQYKENSNEIHSIGLSYLYKYPYKKNVYDGIGAELKNPKKKEGIQLDTCECIFGNTYEKSLKGRVQFGHAMGIQNIHPDENETITVASTPHSSYYPLYLGLNNEDQLQNWDNATQIAGRKRYPIRNALLSNKGTDNMENSMYLLKSGAVFSAKIRFHNLRPFEIGALISALSFHNNSNCFHSIGYGKPLGYGKVKINVKLPNNKKKEDEYIQIFENVMNEFLANTKWINTPQIKELIAMAKGVPNGKENLFSYMEMSTRTTENEFKISKDEYIKGNDYLRRYTDIINNIPKKDDIENLIPKITIESLEKEAGFYLKEGQKYRCNLNADDKVSILSQDRNIRKRIDCPFVICDDSPIKKYIVRDYAEIEIVEVLKHDIDIRILKIFPPKN